MKQEEEEDGKRNSGYVSENGKVEGELEVLECCCQFCQDDTIKKAVTTKRLSRLDGRHFLRRF